MSAFAVGEAGVSGLALIFRRPVALLAWSGVYLVLYGLPIVWMVNVMAPALQSMVAHPGAAAMTGAAQTQMFASISRGQGVNLFVMLGSILAHAVVLCAVCRAVIEPENDRFGYVRLGAQELWVGLVIVVIGIALFVMALLGVVVAAIPVGIGLAMSHAVAGTTSSFPILGLAALLLMGAAVWIGLRLSLAAPMSFAARDFRLFESLALTKGRVWPLLGAGLIALVLVWVVEMGVAIIVFGVALAVIGGGWTALVVDWTQHGVGAAAPWLVIALVLCCLVMAAANAILAAPFATAYKQLTASTGV